jgi:FkbM family methyltransferase
METFQTNYGKITLYKNDIYITGVFKNGRYWDEDTLKKLRKYINPHKNILEIGGHCGTSSIVYSTFIENNNKIFVFEPQKNLYNLLLKNIKDNSLETKIIANNSGVFCYNGIGKMNNKDLDCGGNVLKCYNTQSDISCNFGGICLGNDGESINLITIDSMELDNIGFIHCDAQGSENFIFSKGTELIKKCRPVILYENNELYGKYLYNNVCKTYDDYREE